MIKILKNIKPFWKMAILIIFLLLIQAWCDLSLPQYTSEIIDTGIQNKGIEHVLPLKIKEDEFQNIQLFMTTKEQSLLKSSYQKEGKLYLLSITDEDLLNKRDDQLTSALLYNYQMSQVENSVFRKTIAAQMGTTADKLQNLSIEQIGQAIQVPLKASTKKVTTDGKTEKVTTVDMRPIFQKMVDTGKMKPADLLKSRADMEKNLSKVGDSMIHSMGVSYAIQSSKDAGVNIDAIQKKFLWISGLKMVALALLMAVVTIFVGFFASKIGAGVGMNLRSSIFQKVVRFSSAQIDQFSTASLITRSTNDIQQIQLVTALMLRMIAYAPILGIGGIIKVLQTGADMEWIIVLAVLLIIGLVAILMAVAMPKFKLMQKLVDRLNLVSREILTGIPVIRAFGRERTEEERFEHANKQLTKTMLFTNRVMTFMMPIMMLIMYGLTILIVWVSAHRISDGVLEVGSMTAFITYAMMIVMSFLMLTMMSVMLPRAGVAAARIDEVLKTPFTVVESSDPKKIDSANSTVVFHHVHFRYPNANEDALVDISFTARPGETTAIIGGTGSGKSTLVNLIPRLYDVTEGSITIGGVNIQDLALKDLRDTIGFVPQKGVLFSGTIASNLRFGNKDASDEEIVRAASIAQASEFISEKEDAYNSEIAQGGTNVSGGQKQRLSIARAIAKNPSIYIFDDSFSALDLRTDASLRKSLHQEVQSSTMIIVAQRISTILHAEQIIVIDEGQIVGKGTHEELLGSCEVYQQIAQSQLSATELENNK